MRLYKRQLPDGRERFRRDAGLTILELLVVLLILAVTLGVASRSYGLYLERTAARRAAELFVLDLSLARTTALRDRQPVSVMFSESGRSYEIRRAAAAAGDVVMRRDYGPVAPVKLSQLRLLVPSDSMSFNGRGIASPSFAGSALGEARFAAGRVEYRVRFNSMGAAQVEAVP